VVSERTGLDAISLAVLEALEELDAIPGRPHKKSATVVDHLYATRGIPPRVGYDTTCILAQDWLTQVLLVDFHGNGGSPDPNDRPAAPRYTECRIAPTGMRALASERGELPRLPVGLINGDLAFGGTAPPFDASRVAAALHAAAEDRVTDAALVEMIGLPSLPTGCDVDIDRDALAAGARTMLRMSATIVLEEGRHGLSLVLSHLPFGASAEIIGQTLMSRLDATRFWEGRDDELYERMAIPLRDVRNESADYVTRVVCDLRTGADIELCKQRLLETWPVSVEFPVQLRAPLATLVRHYADSDDPAAQSAAMTALGIPY
jgi:DNA gyrase subunit A